MLTALLLEQGGIDAVCKALQRSTGLVKQAELSVKARR